MDKMHARQKIHFDRLHGIYISLSFELLHNLIVITNVEIFFELLQNLIVITDGEI